MRLTCWPWEGHSCCEPWLWAKCASLCVLGLLLSNQLACSSCGCLITNQNRGLICLGHTWLYLAVVSVRQHTIAQIAPKSFQTSRCTLQWWLSGHQQVRFTLQWSLSGHQHVCSSYSQRTSKVTWRKPRIKDVSNFIKICSTNPIQVLNLQDISRRYCLCPWNDIFHIKKSMLVLGPCHKDRKYPRGEANIGNPKVNRGCPSLTANCTLADCMEITLGPSIQHIPLAVYHTWGFNVV